MNMNWKTGNAGILTSASDDHHFLSDSADKTYIGAMWLLGGMTHYKPFH